MTEKSERERITEILAPGRAYPVPDRDEAWRGVTVRRRRARRDRMIRVAGIAAVALIVAAGLVWRSGARGGASAPIAQVGPGLAESLRVIDASLEALRQPTVGTEEVRVLEEKTFLLEMRGRLIAGSAAPAGALE